MLKLKSALYPFSSSWALVQEWCESSTASKSGSKTDKPSTTKKVAEFQKTLDEEETKKRNETFNKIYNESLVRTKFENWQKVDELHGLGQRAGQFYIYNFEKKEEILLENTDQAFVLPIRDKSDDVTFQAIFAHKDGQWHILKPDGSSQLQLGEASISAESKFVIENNVLDYDH